MTSALEGALKDLWQHVTCERQAWLLGAGVSVDAGIPLMYPLTEYVATLVSEKSKTHERLLLGIRKELPDSCHIEHVLSHIADLVALAERTKAKAAAIAGATVKVEELRTLHHLILECIGYAVRYGYRPATATSREQRGKPGAPIVDVDDHRRFVRQVFASRNKPGIAEAPISFFTLNYDTLVEDALALEQISFADGFIGGAMAYWAPEQSYAVGKSEQSVRARVYKLHGSIDWHVVSEGAVVRCRDGCAYPNRQDNLLIYPQANKYVATQKDPFATLFSSFREILMSSLRSVLGICGYSFGDEHVNEEIEFAMRQPQSRTVIVAFAKEVEEQGQVRPPKKLCEWLSERPWKDRVFVATDRGLYHGNLTNLCASNGEVPWWSFRGLTDYLADGPEFYDFASSQAASSGYENVATLKKKGAA